MNFNYAIFIRRYDATTTLARKKLRFPIPASRRRIHLDRRGRWHRRRVSSSRSAGGPYTRQFVRESRFTWWMNWRTGIYMITYIRIAVIYIRSSVVLLLNIEITGWLGLWQTGRDRRRSQPDLSRAITEKWPIDGNVMIKYHRRFPTNPQRGCIGRGERKWTRPRYGSTTRGTRWRNQLAAMVKSQVLRSNQRKCWTTSSCSWISTGYICGTSQNNLSTDVNYYTEVFVHCRYFYTANRTGVSQVLVSGGHTLS